MNNVIENLLIYKKILLYVIAFFVLTIIGAIAYSRVNSLPESDFVELDELSLSNTLDQDEAINNLYVHIDGAVESPGIKEVSDGTRIFELIEISGGLKEDADISKINLASKLKDEQKVIIPYKIKDNDNISNGGRVGSQTTQKQTSSDSTSFPINLNYATLEDFMKLNGIGPTMAQKIIDFRDEIGYFNTIEDIKKVSGIGEAKFNKIKDDICV